MNLFCRLFGHSVPSGYEGNEPYLQAGYEGNEPYLQAGAARTDANHLNLRNGGRIHLTLQCDCDRCGTKFTVAYAHIGQAMVKIDQEHLEKSKHILSPKINSWWKHHNGNIYTVIAITNQHSDNWDYLPTVVYRGYSGNVWSRPLYDWHRSFTALPNIPEDNPCGEILA